MKQKKIDSVFIGGSAGSLRPLREILAALPETFDAAIFVCLHRAHLNITTIATLLRPHISLPITDAEENEPIKRGRVYVASSDHHMMICAEQIHMRRGAHENNFRPAIDPLMRSAAVYRGTRAIGVVLSGLMDDGAVGAKALANVGGKILVQDPLEADYPDMPTAVLDIVAEAECLTIQNISARLQELVGQDAEPTVPVPWRIGVELKIASMEGNTVSTEERLGELTPYNCPCCNGVLWEIDDPDYIRYRCHTGHAYTAKTLNAAQEKALDEGLWSALRAHKGRGELLRNLADRASGETSKKLLEQRMKKIEEDADRLEGIIEGRKLEAYTKS